jgi:hypothetical protein
MAITIKGAISSSSLSFFMVFKNPAVEVEIATS